MHLRSFSRIASPGAIPALILGLGLGGALAGCGRESLLLDLNPGAGGSGGAGAGGSPDGGAGGGGGPVCTPINELCNTVDDDCDGLVDEDCSCTDGTTQPCYSGPPDTIGVGPCKQGTQQCSGGKWGPCSGETIPITEQCDQVDNDCDGQVDEDNPGAGQPCNIGLPGPCSAGATKCVNGGFVCTQAVFPTAEVCDGIDNNCNGQIDDGNPGTGACTTGQFGVCGPGTLFCENAALECFQNVSPSPEVCDGLDNDCDGQIDEGNPNGGTACTTGLPGPCAQGTTACSGGGLTCVPNAGSVEICDGIDNDCDGVVDDVPGLGNNCLTNKPPPCNQGTLQCQTGSLVCVSIPNNQPETCDGLDNNCNGSVDEGNPGGGATCTTGVPGVCGPGTMKCQSGVVSCVPDASQGPEQCAGTADEDCDGVAAVVYFTETFANNDHGWQLDQEWQIGPATASPTMGIFGNPDPANDHTPTDDDGVAGAVIGGNISQQQHPTRWLTSQDIPVDPAAPTVYLQFWRWLNSDFEPWMTNRVQVFNATTNNWEQVWQSTGGGGITDATWTKQVYDITTKAKGGFIRVRFGFNVGANGAFLVSGWNLDDVVITTEPCD